VYRSGEFKLPDTSSEPQRLTLYVPGFTLDAAEAQAGLEGVETVQEYCAELLRQAIEAKQVKAHVADVEARRGPLEGLHEIADDPEYLAEWSSISTPTPKQPRESPPLTIDMFPSPVEGDANAQAGGGLTPRVEQVEGLSPAARVVLLHAGQGDDDPTAFLPCLRRGESASVAEVAELARALQVLEVETREARAIDRRVAFALHRLAYEGQVLHTDAWPGVFDEWTVDALRAVQEAVERILSGQDIRYFNTNEPRPENLP
jgi:hypothetical protein